MALSSIWRITEISGNRTLRVHLHHQSGANAAYSKGINPMTSTILATFDDIENARDAIADLTDAGYRREDIGFAVYHSGKQYAENLEADVSAAEGAGFGAIVGSLFGAAIGLAAITIPGVGPVIAAGPLAAAIGALTGAGIGAASGAVTGGITGSLVRLGVSAVDAAYHAESSRLGAALVSVTVYEHDAERALYLLQKHDPIDIDKRVAQWRARGWSGYDPMVDPFKAEERYELERDNAILTPDEEYDEFDEYLDEEYPRGVRSYPQS
jgi:hypothetical protein